MVATELASSTCHPNSIAILQMSHSLMLLSRLVCIRKYLLSTRRVVTCAPFLTTSLPFSIPLPSISAGSLPILESITYPISRLCTQRSYTPGRRARWMTSPCCCCVAKLTLSSSRIRPPSTGRLGFVYRQSRILLWNTCVINWDLFWPCNSEESCWRNLRSSGTKWLWWFLERKR